MSANRATGTTLPGRPEVCPAGLSPEARALAEDPAAIAKARGMARRLSSAYRIPIDQALSSALFGLVKAARRFDPATSPHFLPYAERWMLSIILYDMRAWSGSGRIGPRRRVVSLDLESIDVLSGEDCPSREVDAADAFEALLGPLPPRHRDVMRAIYLECRYGGSLTEAGKALGVSTTRIGQIRRRSIEIIREELAGRIDRA